MNEIENKVLFFLESRYKIDTILKELGMDEESLANIIIELETKGLITLEDKNWILTQKGKDILKDIREELLKKLKIDYLYGNMSKDEFQKKKKELESLESIVLIEKPHAEDKIEDKKLEKKLIEDKNINCPKCGKENKIESKYCYKCGEPLKN